MPGLIELREECGVYGIWRNPDAARLGFYALQALQHRGQESAGLTVAQNGHLETHRGMGLVHDVFDEDVIQRLQGDRAIGHVRYSTSGESSLTNAQPLVFRYRGLQLAMAHNGNLVDAPLLRRSFEEKGAIFQTTSDTEVIAHLMAHARTDDLVEAAAKALSQVHGGFAVVMLTSDMLLAARDPNGIRPLCLGRLQDGWVLASETCAFDTIGAEFIREIAPGELLKISDGGLETRAFHPAGREAMCIFEFIYFARPDSHFLGTNVHSVRKRLGRFLAEDYPAEADVVVGVPDSSISAAIGYSEQSGIPYEMGLIKNRYIGRTFIQPSQASRQLGVRLKLNPVRHLIEGRRVALIDDSIVRGTTSRHLVRLLRDAGAREVHMRISSPPYRHACHYGIDTADDRQLIANRLSIEEMERNIGVDSLAFLSVERVAEAVGTGVNRFCTACFTGDYPVRVDQDEEREASPGLSLGGRWPVKQPLMSESPKADSGDDGRSPHMERP